MPFHLSEATQILRGTPVAVTAMVGGIPQSWQRATEGGGTWSCYDIVGHLIHGEMTDWIPRARIILAHGESRAFEPFDRVAQFREDQSRPISALLEQFTFLRSENVRALEGFRLTSSDLTRRGLHPELGTVTMEQLLAAWVVHDLSHLSQIARVSAKQYLHDVGPWRSYMSVLKT
jgi:hypothetical protein